MSDEAYARALRGLYARANQGIKLGLTTMQALLDALGRPDGRMRHVVVAGTNGKGSTSAIIAGALRQAGYHVGHFTSPHLLRFTERIRVGGSEISRADVIRLSARVCAVEHACPRAPTFFELVTAMALVAFAEAAIDVAVLEVGMGGRLDATNAVDKLLSVITPVDLDHQQFLGETLSAIAYEKAGIIAEGGTVVAASQKPEAWVVLEEVAAARQARLVTAAPTRVTGGQLIIDLPPPALSLRAPAALFQRQNLATAATALRELAQLGVSCPDDALERAAAELRWPGRYEWLAGPPETLVDGAHNPAAIHALLAALEADPRARGRPLHVVTTVLSDRPPAEMLPPLWERATSLHLTPVSSRRSRSLDELAALEPRAQTHASAAQALDAAGTAARSDGGLRVVCGSLFLAGEALSLLRSEPRDPPIDA